MGVSSHKGKVTRIIRYIANAPKLNIVWHTNISERVKKSFLVLAVIRLRPRGY